MCVPRYQSRNDNTKTVAVFLRWICWSWNSQTTPQTLLKAKVKESFAHSRRPKFTTHRCLRAETNPAIEQVYWCWSPSQKWKSVKSVWKGRQCSCLQRRPREQSIKQLLKHEPEEECFIVWKEIGGELRQSKHNFWKAVKKRTDSASEFETYHLG